MEQRVDLTEKSVLSLPVRGDDGLDAERIDGAAIDIEYRLLPAQKPGLPCCVMLHEGLGSVTTWRDFPERLNRDIGCAVLVYSRPGYGKSSSIRLPRPLDYMEQHALKLLPRLLAELKLGAYFLLGHSDGATIATVYAGGVSDKNLRGLVLLAPHFFTEPAGLESISKTQDLFYEGSDLQRGLQRHHGDNTDSAYWGWFRAWMDPGFESWSIVNFLPNIKVPMIILQGEDDEYGTSAHLEAAQHKSAGLVETKMFASCGHAPFRDQPDQLLEEISRFMPNFLS